jgi:hypothetical protein
MNAQTKFDIPSAALIAKPFAVDYGRLTDQARARFDSETLQSIIAERMIKSARKEGNFGGSPQSIIDLQYPKNDQPDPAKPTVGMRVMDCMGDDWESAKSIMEKVGGRRTTMRDALRVLIDQEKLEYRASRGSIGAMYRKAQP